MDKYIIGKLPKFSKEEIEKIKRRNHFEHMPIWDVKVKAYIRVLL